MDNVYVTSNKSVIDFERLHQFLSKKAYWALGRTMEQVKKTVEFSESFSIFKNDVQIGFARVTTDYVALAYLADVFIVENERGNGYSKQLLDFIFEYPVLKPVQTWRLMSTDARGLYTSYGFTPLASPEKMMERKIYQK